MSEKLKIALKAFPELREAIESFLVEYQKTPKFKMLKVNVTAEEMLKENLIYNTIESVINKLNELADEPNSEE